MKNILAFLFLFTCSFVNGQRLLQIKYNYQTNAFEDVLYNVHWSGTLEHFPCYIFKTHYDEPISIQSSGYYNSYATNNINDSNFIHSEHLLDPDTLFYDSTNFEIYNTLDFDYVNHVISPDNKIFRTVRAYKYVNYPSFPYPPTLEKGYYILKSDKLNLTNQYPQGTEPDSIEAYYKIPDNQLGNLYTKNKDTLFIVATTNTDINSLRTVTFHITELDTQLNVITQHTFNHSIPYVGVQTISYYTDKNNQLNFCITENNTGIVHLWKYKSDFTPLDSITFGSGFNLEEYFRSNGNIHIYYGNDSLTNIHILNNNTDTIRTVRLRNNDNNNVLIGKDSSFYILNMEVIPYVAIDIAIHKFDKQGRPLFKRYMYEINHNYDYSLFEYRPLKYDIDTLDNIQYGYDKMYSAGATWFLESFISVFNIMNFRKCTGNVTFDKNKNCIKDSTELGLKNVLLELQLNNKTYYGMSDQSGAFYITTYDTGHAKLIVHYDRNIFYRACSDTFSVYISDTTDIPNVEVLLQTPPCGYQQQVGVEISTPFLRRCFDNIYTLTLSNKGTDTISHAYADITLDEHLFAVDTAFSSAENLGNNTYRFHFYNLAPLENVLKNLTIHVDCNTTQLGQTHCVKAVSYPYTPCLVIDGPRMQATSSCRNDSVLFSIKNIGYPSNLSFPYRILADDSIFTSGTLDFTFTQPERNISIYNPHGYTLRLETVQFPIYPNEDTLLSTAIEGCGNDTFSMGFITQYTQDDDAPNVAIDCHQNVGSFDPNEKSAQPEGYGSAHLIEANQAINYTIHFQNTGTYAASNVTALDTLSSLLDMRTFQFISSSFPCTISILDSNVLKFNFVNINLESAAIDSLLSNGYVQFSIKPKANIAIGTPLNNQAYITFDYNEAIVTNSVHFEIGHDFLKPSIILLTKNHLFSSIETKIYPNPNSAFFTLEINGNIPEKAQLNIYAINGQCIYHSSTIRNQQIIDTKNWSRGIYLFEIKDENQLIQSGKIIVQ